MSHKKKQSEIAEYLGIKQNSYSNCENGKRPFSLEMIVALADYYHVTTDYLLGRSDSPFPEEENHV